MWWLWWWNPHNQNDLVFWILILRLQNTHRCWIFCCFVKFPTIIQCRKKIQFICLSLDSYSIVFFLSILYSGKKSMKLIDFFYLFGIFDSGIWLFFRLSIVSKQLENPVLKPVCKNCDFRIHEWWKQNEKWEEWEIFFVFLTLLYFIEALTLNSYSILSMMMMMMKGKREDGWRGKKKNKATKLTTWFEFIINQKIMCVRV